METYIKDIVKKQPPGGFAFEICAPLSELKCQKIQSDFQSLYV